MTATALSLAEVPQDDQSPPRSVFEKTGESIFEKLDVEITFLDRLVGGCPKDFDLVMGWLRKGLGVTNQEELLLRANQHMVEMGVEGARVDQSADELSELTKKMAGEIKTQGFKRDVHGNPVWEGRFIKAGIKESVNILYAKQKWGPTKKGPQGFTAERVFPVQDKIPLDGDVMLDLSVGHINGPDGPRSTIGYYEYVERPVIRFQIEQLLSQNTSAQEPALTFEQWSEVWSHLERNGLGTMRSQGFGRFVVTKFERL